MYYEKYIANYFFIAGIITITLAYLSTTHIKYTKRKNGFLMGFTGGVLLSFISFEIFPVIFLLGGFYQCIIYVIISIILIGLFEEIQLTKKEVLTKENFLILILISTIEKVILGISIGGILQINLNHIFQVLALMVFHLFVEVSETIFSLKKYLNKKRWIFLFITVTILPYGYSIYIGEVLVKQSERYFLLFLSILIGKAIFTAFGVMIPKSRALWNGRLSIYGSCFGFLTGIIINHIFTH